MLANFNCLGSTSSTIGSRFPQGTYFRRYNVQPKPAEEAESQLVQTSMALHEAVQQLAKADVIGVDVEHNHLRSYRGIVCLVQVHAGLDPPSRFPAHKTARDD